jgi:acid stress-induced BolA-like protein IbaG/YrbA
MPTYVLVVDLDGMNSALNSKSVIVTEEFTKVMDVKRHVLVKCFYDNLVKKKEINNISINSEGDYNNNLNNCILNNNITQNIYVDMKPVIPFDDDWDLSKLDDNIKGRLLISKIMYTTLLEEILKNDKNLNVIIDNESNLGVFSFVNSGK